MVRWNRVGEIAGWTVDARKGGVIAAGGGFFRIHIQGADSQMPVR